MIVRAADDRRSARILLAIEIAARVCETGWLFLYLVDMFTKSGDYDKWHFMDL